MTDKTVNQALQLISRPVFTTREIAVLRNGSLSSTSQSLSQLEDKGLVRRLIRGVWCNPSDYRFSPFSVISFLVPGHRAYISFISALHLHGIIEQIPQIIYAATTGHGRLITTGVTTYSFHQLKPEIFCGFNWYNNREDFLIATPEKALVDSLYISSRRGKRFSIFPELHFGRSFSFPSARRWAKRIPDRRILGYVLKKLGDIEESIELM